MNTQDNANTSSNIPFVGDTVASASSQAAGGASQTTGTTINATDSTTDDTTTSTTEGTTSTEGTTEQATDAQAPKAERKSFELSLPMFALAVVVMVVCIYLASFGALALFTWLFGTTAGCLITLALQMCGLYWLYTSSKVDAVLESYLAFFGKTVDPAKKAAQAQAAADVAANFAAQAPAEAAAFEGAVPA
jgi:flagellar basal body-associated protein FliL